MEDKAIGVEINDIIMRIRDRQNRREEMKTRKAMIAATNAKIMDSLSDVQSIGRSMRDTSTKTSVSVGTSVLTMDDIDEAMKKMHELCGIRRKKITVTRPEFIPLEDLSFERPATPEPVEWKLSTWNMNTISLVSNPEPGCEIKVSPEDAFNYAMKLVEK